eukprot:GHVP01025993.1.p1 GENE.GHVP01025993.1~~GHVP01025993.1.p1  ORF type:complete len:121 (-),score=11.93 GHVP01025993.1:786-1148(-)
MQNEFAISLTTGNFGLENITFDSQLHLSKIIRFLWGNTTMDETTLHFVLILLGAGSVFPWFIGMLILQLPEKSKKFLEPPYVGPVKQIFLSLVYLGLLLIWGYIPYVIISNIEEPESRGS